MLVSLKIENFKNFKDEQNLILHDSNEDSCAFSVLVGNNGAGKSSVLDAIEWVAFNRSAKTLRASKNDDLISIGKNFLSVEALFINSYDKSSLRITRTHSRGGQTRSFAILNRHAKDSRVPRSLTLNGAQKISNALQEVCRVDMNNLERIVIKQQDASSIACTKPKIMFDKLELIFGTDKLKAAASDFYESSNKISSDYDNTLATRGSLMLQMEAMYPSVQSASKLREEERMLDYSLSGLFSTELLILQNSSLESSEKLKCLVRGQIKNTESIQELVIGIDTINKQLITSKSYERKVSVSRMMSQNHKIECEDELSRLIMIKRHMDQKNVSRARKISEIQELIQTQEAKLIRLYKSLKTTSKQLIERQSQAAASHTSLYHLFGQQNDVSSLFDERLLHIRIVLAELKELEDAKNGLDIWAQNLNDIYLQQCRSRRSLDHKESILVEFYTKKKENMSVLLKVEGDLAVLFRKKRCAEESLIQLQNRLHEGHSKISKFKIIKEGVSNDSKIMKRFDEFDWIRTNVHNYPGCHDTMIEALCNLILPQVPSLHTTALLAVFGRSLTETLVVNTRSTATIVAQICRKALIFSLTIVILEEIESADDFTAFQHYQKRPKNDVPISSKFEATTEKVLIPMIQCVKLKYNTILSFINKKLRSWSFYDGIGYEAFQHIKSTKQNLQRIVETTNVVARDGSRIMYDGEIRVSCGLSSSNFSSKNYLDAWPSRIRDPLMATKIGDLEHFEALKLSVIQSKTEVSSMILALNEINELLQRKNTQLYDMGEFQKVLEEDVLLAASEGHKPFETIEDLQLHMNQSILSFTATSDRLALDRQDQEKAVNKLSKSTANQEKNLTLLLKCDGTSDGQQLQRTIIEKSAEHEKIVSSIATLESKIRINSSEINILDKKIQTQKENLRNLRKDCSMDSNHEEQIDKETLEKRSGGTGEETFIMENRRLQDILGMASQDCQSRELQYRNASDTTRLYVEAKTLARSKLDRMRMKDRRIIKQIDSATAELSTTGEAINLKMHQILMTQEKLRRPLFDLKSLIRETDDFFNDEEFISALTPVNATEYMPNTTAGTNVSEKLGDHINLGIYYNREKKVMVDKVERTILNLTNEDFRSRKHARGNRRRGATSLSQSAQDSCQVTKKDELSDVQDLESSQDHYKLGINCFRKRSKSLIGHQDIDDTKSSLDSRSAEIDKKENDSFIKHHIDAGKVDNVIDLAQLDLLSGQLSLRSICLEKRISKIDIDATFAEYLDLHEQCKNVTISANSLKLRAQVERHKGNTVHERRFTLLMQYLQMINIQLSKIYKKIVPEADCYLSYASNPISLFEEGVTLLAQYDRNAWREAIHLSGGQQAACSLSLVLAIQDCFPSPIYIMDEVDASLDTSTVTRVGALIREKSFRSKIQFIMVSHRPEMQENATRLVGLYICNEIPQTLSVGFETSVKTEVLPEVDRRNCSAAMQLSIKA